MVVAHATTGHSLPVKHYFSALHDGLCQAGMSADVVQRHQLEGQCVALETVDGEFGLDNGFNLLETSTRAVRRSEGGLLALAQIAERGCSQVWKALEADDACVLNASQHPNCSRDLNWYQRVRVPRPIYRELVEYRGWRHWEGIDAKAQNGANVQVAVVDATRALNVMIGLAAVHVALFANSPLESGCVTGLKETRLTVWPRVFQGASFSGDALLTRFPPRPFVDLGDYFRWIFRPGTVSRSVPMARRHDYKSAPTVLLDGAPSLSAFLAAKRWTGRRTDNGERVEIVPDAGHFEHSQIAQFMDARLRYRFGELPPLNELVAAWRRPDGLEGLFDAYGAIVYIEGRGPGAGFADAALLEETDAPTARSLIMSPAALQWGLLQRLDDAEALMANWRWGELSALRDRAMQRGIEDREVWRLCEEAVAIALTGLSMQERPLLDYARHVLASRRTGADRMLETWRATAGMTPTARLEKIVQRHRAVDIYT